MQCLVTGKKAQVARLHPSIKGVANAQPAGASLVSFNSHSYESYEKSQGANSPISKVAAFKYGTVLNYMLADRQHKLKLGDSTIVYWANSEKKQYQEIANLLFAPGSINKDTKEKTVDTETEIVVRDILLKISNGEIADNVLFHDDTEFSILALSPNTSRLSVRFFIQNNFGDFLKKICKHYEDLKIEKQCKDDLDYISLWEILSQTVSPNSKDKSASPLLAGSVLKSIISGTSYPKILLNYVMLRIKAERNINYQKVAIIKAYLIRQSSKKYMEVLTMSLNKDSKNIAYLLGRLFAVLENVQYDANKSSNIKDRYFSSASSTPSTVFPTLLKLSQHHISKAEYGMNSDMMVEDILSKIDIIENPIPSNLSLEEQGVFVLGYYHQRNDFYKSK